MKVVVLRDLSGVCTHWFRYYKIGKAWHTACQAVPTQAENEHRKVMDARAAINALRCPACKGRLAQCLATRKNITWEDLFHGFE